MASVPSCRFLGSRYSCYESLAVCQRKPQLYRSVECIDYRHLRVRKAIITSFSATWAANVRQGIRINSRIQPAVACEIVVDNAVRQAVETVAQPNRFHLDCVLLGRRNPR